MTWITPKLDWKATDYINAEDFNRIENNISEVADFLNSINYVIPSLTHITNRTISSIDYLSSINRIESNIEAIKNAFISPPNYQGSKIWIVGQSFNHRDAIRLERNVKQLMEYGLLVVESFVYCGTLSSGFERGMI